MINVIIVDEFDSSLCYDLKGRRGSPDLEEDAEAIFLFTST